MNINEIREKMNDTPMIGYGVPGAIFFLALLYAMMVIFGSNDDGNRTAVEQQWYYDVVKKQKFAAKASQNPPILAPDQQAGDTPNGVLAHYVTCGSCSDAELGWLEKYSEEAHKAFADDDIKFDPRKGQLIRPKEGGEKDWVVASSPEGLKLTRAFYNKCKDTLKECYPGD